jgi:hypothetical protein
MTTKEQLKDHEKRIARIEKMLSYFDADWTHYEKVQP